MGTLLELIVGLTSVPTVATSATPLVEVASLPLPHNAQAAKTASTSPAWIDRPASAQQQAVTVEQLDDEPQRTLCTAATAPPEWLEARDRYYSHLMACRACYAPLERYCTAGADLRQQYDNTPMESTR